MANINEWLTGVRVAVTFGLMNTTPFTNPMLKV